MKDDFTGLEFIDPLRQRQKNPTFLIRHSGRFQATLVCRALFTHRFLIYFLQCPVAPPAAPHKREGGLNESRSYRQSDVCICRGSSDGSSHRRRWNVNGPCHHLWTVSHLGRARSLRGPTPKSHFCLWPTGGPQTNDKQMCSLSASGHRRYQLFWLISCLQKKEWKYFFALFIQILAVWQEHLVASPLSLGAEQPGYLNLPSYLILF